MKTIRVLVDCHYFGAYYSGVTTYIRGIYNALVNHQDFEIYLASSTPAELHRDFPDERFRHVELRSKSRLKRLLYEIPQIIRNHGINYAHFQYVVPLEKKCRYIVTLHDVLFEDYPNLFSVSYRLSRSLPFHISAKRADILLTVSEYSRRRISAHYHIPLESICVTPNGICGEYDQSKERECEPATGQRKRYILYVSRIEPRKNHKMLIEAFVELELYKEYDLILIGKPSISDERLNFYMSRLPHEVKKGITRLDNVTNRELVEYYRNASLFVYPSLAEGFGLPPLEAIMANARTICSSATAMSDYAFMKGYQFDPSDKGMLKSLIIKTLNDNNYPFVRMQSEIRNKYNWANAAEVLAGEIRKNAGRCDPTR